MFDYFDEEIAREEKDTIIQDFLDRHGLRATEWYSVMERGYLKAVVIGDMDDPLFPGFAYWLIRHELYRKRKENHMGKKINYPSFAWSPKRQIKLNELFQEGKSISEMAAYFGVDESTICQRIDKYGFKRVFKDPSEAVTPTLTAPAQSQKEEVSLPDPAVEPPPEKENLSKAIYIDLTRPDIHTLLKDLLHYVVDANNHNNDTMAALDEMDEYRACFELGQQCVKLSEAEKIIKNLSNLFQEP